MDEPGTRLGDKVAEQALAWNADLVVVGTHGRKGLSRAMLGSGAEQIVRFAPVPVLVVREKVRR
jgi:nucleotide-binding universal stress UspA family protein